MVCVCVCVCTLGFAAWWWYLLRGLKGQARFTNHDAVAVQRFLIGPFPLPIPSSNNVSNIRIGGRPQLQKRRHRRPARQRVSRTAAPDEAEHDRRDDVARQGRASGRLVVFSLCVLFSISFSFHLFCATSFLSCFFSFAFFCKMGGVLFCFFCAMGDLNCDG